MTLNGDRDSDPCPSDLHPDPVTCDPDPPTPCGRSKTLPRSIRLTSLPRAGALPRGEPVLDAPLGETCFGPQQSGMVKGAEVVRTCSGMQRRQSQALIVLRLHHTLVMWHCTGLAPHHAMVSRKTWPSRFVHSSGRTHLKKIR